MVAALRGDLAEHEAGALEKHVRTCAACAAEVGALRAAWTALDAVPAVTPPVALRSSVLAAIASARKGDAHTRPSWRSEVRFLIPGVAAALASVAFLVAPDPDCRTPLAIAACGAVWAGVYALAFAVLMSSYRKGPARVLAGRGLAAAAGGLLLVRLCPTEDRGSVLPFLSDLATQAASSPAIAFALGSALAALPLALAVICIPARAGEAGLRDELVTGAMYFTLLAPALYLGSSFLALGGLLALLGGAALGALAPLLVELLLRRTAAGAV
ncbi:MAG: hypothetical protein SFX73_34635 [Kofleriaceae bacterium]|nr:hypothetical protein [Kofleriaceae bacterium]